MMKEKKPEKKYDIKDLSRKPEGSDSREYLKLAFEALLFLSLIYSVLNFLSGKGLIQGLLKNPLERLCEERSGEAI